MANKKQQLDNPALPSLGLSAPVYSQNVQNQNNGLLRLFFTKLTNVIGSLIGPSGGKYLNNPHGAFKDTTDQSAAFTTTAYPLTLNTTDYANGVSVVSNSRITVDSSGIWNLQYSLQLKNTAVDGVEIDVWLRKNGTNIDNSNRKFYASPRKIATTPSFLIASSNYPISLETSDYIEIVWRTEDVLATIDTIATSSSPTRPAVPSAIVTMTFVSNLPNL
tara:strand:- start:397 stop:1053 length:657 start_codon:yes stop_codon:yes gene_type:complete